MWMDLLLLTEDEYNSLQQDIKIELIEYAKDEDVLTRLYLASQYDRIIVTKRYVDMVGANKVYNALKALTCMTDQLISKIFLLNHRKGHVDRGIADLASLGVKAVDLDVQEMDYDTYTGLNLLKRIDTSNLVEDTLPDEIREITNVLKDLKSDNLREYVNMNYDKITSTVLKCEQILNKYEEAQEDNKKRLLENRQLSTALVDMRDMYITEKYYNSVLDKQVEDARNFILRYAESIKSFNDAVQATNMGDEFVYRDKYRKTVVIYFKELEDIGFFRIFNELYENFKSIHNYRVKALVIEGRNRRFFNPYQSYKILNVQPKMNEITLNDKLVKYGNARKVIEVLSRPQLCLEFLLVYDRSYTQMIGADFSNQLTYYIGNKRANYAGFDFEIPDENFISPYEGSYVSTAFLYKRTADVSDIGFRVLCNQSEFFKGLLEISKQMLAKA